MRVMKCVLVQLSMGYSNVSATVRLFYSDYFAVEETTQPQA